METVTVLRNSLAPASRGYQLIAGCSSFFRLLTYRRCSIIYQRGAMHSATHGL